jgi:hypothetical protein
VDIEVPAAESKVDTFSAIPPMKNRQRIHFSDPLCKRSYGGLIAAVVALLVTQAAATASG